MRQRPPLQANRPKLPVSPGENHIVSWLPKVQNVLPVSHIHMSWHAGCGGPGWTTLPCHVQSVCKRLAYTLPPPEKAAQRLGVLGPLLNRRSGLSVRNGVLLYKQVIRPMMDYASPIWRSAARSTSGSCKCYKPCVFALRLTHLGTLVRGKFTRNWGLHPSPTTSEHWLRASTQS
jgi:hypothetical protein